MAEGPRTVLLAIDSSDNSENAFHWYVENMHKTGDEVIIFHCHEHPQNYSKKPVKKEDWGKFDTKEDEKLKALENKYTEKLKSNNIEGKVLIHGGHIGNEICNQAETHGASMIVVGTRGLGTIRRTILGSTSDHVLHHSHIPVIVVPKPSQA